VLFAVGRSRIDDDELPSLSAMPSTFLGQVLLTTGVSTQLACWMLKKKTTHDVFVTSSVIPTMHVVV
jgi:hypothetical protein